MYTPFKTFNRRRNFLVWLHNDKYRFLFNDEEIARRDKCEQYTFKTSVGMKALGIFLLMNIRVYKRPPGRMIAYDCLLTYFGIYSILASNIPGVFYTWDSYKDLVKKLLESEKLRKRGLLNINEFLN